MLFQLVLTNFFKRELFSVYLKLMTNVTKSTLSSRLNSLLGSIHKNLFGGTDEKFKMLKGGCLKNISPSRGCGYLKTYEKDK